MPTIYPFKGYRFDPKRVEDVSRVVTQPYDKIPDSLRQDYLARSEFNIVRVIKNPDYDDAARNLEAWTSSGVLRRDSEPSFYIYRQTFSYDGPESVRTGLIALVSLDDSDLVVKGHENVLDRPLADRLELIRRTRANEGLIFTLFSDPELESDRYLEAACADSPADLEVVDDFGVKNQLWVVSDPKLISGLRELMLGRALYIADGHHRFQTSVQFHRECLQAGLVPVGSESFDKRMVALFNMESEGLRILPTHRGVRGLDGFKPENFFRAATSYFEVESVAGEREMTQALDAGRLCLGVATSDGVGGVTLRLLRLKPEAVNDQSFMPRAQGPVRDLDVTVLHEGVLSPLLGLDARAVAGEEYVRYFRDRRDLLDQVAAGDLQIGFLLRATSLDQVREVSEQGAKMPQKSTDFYPKLLTGLVLMKMDMEQ